MAKDEPEELQPVEGMPQLSETDYVFFVRLRAGDDYITAFRGAVECAHWAERKIHRAALELRNSPHIQAALLAAMAADTGGDKLTHVAHSRNLQRISIKAENEKNYTAALNAEIARGKAAGLYVERLEVAGTWDPLGMLRRMADIDEGAARALATRFGIPFENVQGRSAPLLSAPSSPDESPEST